MVLALPLTAWVLVEAVGTGDALTWTWPVPFLRDLALVALTVCSAWGLGKTLAGGVLVGLHPFDQRLGCIALGLGVQVVLLFGLGVASCLSRTTVACVLAAGLLAACLGGRRPSASASGESVERIGPGWRWEEKLVAAAGAVAALISFRGALLPEVFFDALHYHDSLPALFLVRHRIEVLPHAVHGVMPANVNLLFLPLLSWGGASTVKLAHFLMWLGSAGWALVLGRRLGGRLGGLVSAALVLGVPGVGVMAGFGGVDLGVTFFVLGGLSLTVAALGKRSGPLLVGASVLMGVAGGAKYTVLPTLGLWAAATAGSWLGRHRDSRSVRALATTLIVCALVACPWYVRNWWVLGNPVYPAFEPAGSEGARVVARVRADATPPGPWRLVGGDLLSAFGELRPFGAGAEVLPVSIALAVGLLLGVSRKEGQWLAVVAAGMLLIWSRSVQILRYAYPALGIAAALAALALQRAGPRLARWVSAAVAALVLGGGVRVLAIQGALMGDASDYLMVRQSLSEFLAARLPHFQAAQWVAANTPERGTRLLLVGETQGYYFGRDFEPVSAYNQHPLAGWALSCSGGEELTKLLRSEGFTHIVVNAAELDRLNRRYQHLPLAPREAQVVREMLAACTRAWAGAGVSVYALGPPA